MTWNNYGKWYVDHIKPLSKFDLTVASEQFKACHYSNCNLWAEENIEKKDRLDWKTKIPPKLRPAKLHNLNST